MQKLIRVLIIYTAITATLLLTIALLLMRDNTEQNRKVQASIDSLKQESAKITAYEQSAKEIAQKLDNLNSIASSPNTKVLGTSNPATEAAKIASGFVTMNDKKWQTVDVYESNSYSSKIVGKIEFGKVYQYLKKDGSWYQIVLPEAATNGWVAGRFLKEVADNGPALPAGEPK